MSTPITYQHVLMDRYKLIYDWLPQGCTRVLDIGCGNGNFTQWLTHKASVVVGLDHNDRQVSEAVSFKGLNGVAASAEDLPFADSTFDAVILSDVLEHVDSAQKALHEAIRVLSDDGILITSLPNTGPLAVLDGDNIVNRLVFLLSKLRIPKRCAEDGSSRHFYEDFVFHRHRHYGMRDISRMLGNSARIQKHSYRGTLLWPLCYLVEKILEVFFKRPLVETDYRLLRRLRAMDFQMGIGNWSYNLVVAIEKVTQCETQS